MLPKLPRTVPQPIADADLDLAVAQAGSERLLAWLLLACLCGLRVAEIAAVERADVLDRRDPPMLLVHGKGAKERVVPLPAVPLLHVLRPFLSRPGPLFWRCDGTGPVSPAIVDQTVNNHLRALGIGSTAHSLRKWYGTNVYEISEHDVVLTAALLGHDKLDTVSIYVRCDQSSAAPVVSRLARQIAI